MSDEREAPMEALDKQVREFTATALERDGLVTGWVLMVATSRIDEDGDALYATDYSVGPGQQLVASVGVVEVARRAMYRDIAGCTCDEDDQ